MALELPITHGCAFHRRAPAHVRIVGAQKSPVHQCDVFEPAVVSWREAVGRAGETSRARPPLSRTLSRPSFTSAWAASRVAPAAASWAAWAWSRSWRASSRLALTGAGSRMSSTRFSSSGATSNHSAVGVEDVLAGFGERAPVRVDVGFLLELDQPVTVSVTFEHRRRHFQPSHPFPRQGSRSRSMLFSVPGRMSPPCLGTTVWHNPHRTTTCEPL